MKLKFLCIEIDKTAHKLNENYQYKRVHAQTHLKACNSNFLKRRSYFSELSKNFVFITNKMEFFSFRCSKFIQNCTLYLPSFSVNSLSLFFPIRKKKKNNKNKNKNSTQNYSIFVVFFNHSHYYF